MSNQWYRDGSELVFLAHEDGILSEGVFKKC